MRKTSEAYKSLCTEFYELDKPFAPPDAIAYYLRKADEAKGKILESMCGTGCFLIPLLEKGYEVLGNELDDLLQENGFQVEQKHIPYTTQEADENASVVLYECRKARK